jgi:hypothetical protein
MDVQMRRSVGDNLAQYVGRLVVALMMGACPVDASAQPVAAGPSVQATLLSDVQTLLDNDIPVGVTLGQGDTFDVSIPPTAGRLGDVATRTRASLMNAFGQRWGRWFTVVDSPRVINVTSARSAVCGAALERNVKGHVFLAAPFEILNSVMSDLDPSLKRLPPPGIVSGGGDLSDSVRGGDVLTLPISVATPEGPLQVTLNELVGARSMLGWFASERCDPAGRCGCYIGLVTPTAVLHASYDAVAGASRRQDPALLERRPPR